MSPPQTGEGDTLPKPHPLGASILAPAVLGHSAPWPVGHMYKHNGNISVVGSQRQQHSGDSRWLLCQQIARWGRRLRYMFAVRVQLQKRKVITAKTKVIGRRRKV